MDPEAWGDVDQQLVALCRSAGPLRAARAEISDAFVRREAWKKLGRARLSDYADEHLGCSARSVLDIARAGRCFRALPRLRDALASGELGWTKVRQLVRIVRSDDLGTWIAYARQVTSDTLSREVRKVDADSVERGGHEPDRSRSHLFMVECTPDVRLQWRNVHLQAQRVHGGRLRTSDFAEMLAAETLSAIPLEHDVELETALGASASSDAVPEDGTGAASSTSKRGEKGDPETARPADESRVPLPPELQALLDGLEDADAAELDRRMHLVVELERRRDAEIGPLLEQVVRRLYWRLGYASREAYARDRLGMQPSWMRELLRIERAARGSPSLATAYRTGGITALQAATLAPLVFAELDEGQVERWVQRAPRITLRRLRDEVEDAIALCDTDFETWCRTGGLPVEVSPETAESPGDDAADKGESDTVGPGDPDRQIRARHTHPFEKCAVMCSIEPAVRRLLQAVICTVQRRVERETGVLPTKGEALGLILDHAFESWGAI